MKTVRLLFALSLCLIAACQQEEDPGFEIFSKTYDFNTTSDGWASDFTDYPVGATVEADSIYAWKAEYPATCPSSTDHGLMLTCNDVYGGIFMFIKKKLQGFQPNTNYTLRYQIELTTNAPQGVVLKAGASELEPKKVIEVDHYILNVDKGSKTSSGENLVAVGDIGVPANSSYSKLVLGNTSTYDAPIFVKSNSKGEIWLIIGTDSSIQGITTVYYSEVNVIFNVSN
jgi:hypothetical protein